MRKGISKGKKIGGIILVILGTLGVGIGIIFGLLFGAVSSVFEDEEFGSMMDTQMAEIIEGGIPTEGTITDIDYDEGLATVEYYSETEECWYETQMPAMSENYSIGDTVTVYYDLNNPDYPELDALAPEMFGDAMGAVGDMMPAVGGVFGGVFGVIGLIMLIIGIVLLVGYHKDKKWMEEINARNNGPMGTQPMYGQQPGQPFGQQPNQPYNGNSQGNNV